MEPGLLRESQSKTMKYLKSIYRYLRAKVLSVGISPKGVPSLAEDEREASKMVSVIVAVHDGLEVTRRCFGSLKLFGGEAEVIVVDDGSKSPEVRQLLDETCSRNGWRLIRHESARGHSRACESGVAASTKPVFCLLNSDTLVTPRSWSGVVRAFRESGEIAVVGPSTSETPTRQRVWRAFYCRRHWSDNQIYCFAEKYVKKHQGEAVTDLGVIGGFAFFMRRQFWDQLGGFDRNLPDYGNETELCIRLNEAGLRNVWTKASYIHHLGNESYGKSLGIAAIRNRCQQADSYIQKAHSGGRKQAGGG